MAKARTICTDLVYTLVLAVLVLNCQCQERKVHIVYLGNLPLDREVSSVVTTTVTTHYSILTNVIGSASLAQESLVYNYHRSFNGFAAKLTTQEAATISKMEGVVSVFPNRILHPQTTRSWDFMGFANDNFEPSQEGDVIVALIDTGIWPEHESFNDEGFSALPPKWKGTCKAENFTCNKKLIGARFYNFNDLYDATDIKSPRDTDGHGTHTSSIAVGRKIAGANYLGLAKGIARGGFSNARIAAYKVCWGFGCADADILKAFDDAIADGVDIISVSLGYSEMFKYFEDPIAIGTFHAMKNGILTSASAGNSGPKRATLANYAPWTLTVAASTIDRKFITRVMLGNGQVINGYSINNFNISGNGTAYPLIYGGDIANYTGGSNSDIARFCEINSLVSNKVEGKIVLCDKDFNGGSIVFGDGVGTIIADATIDVANNGADTFPLPAAVITKEEGLKILEYIRSREYPVGTILVSDEHKDILAPMVVSFSSRGPNPISPDILKPDITAPGVDILAAWSPLAPPSIYYSDKRSVMYNVLSGTSMATSHVSGAAAYVKAVHPNWSAAAIKSALMTTSHSLDPTNNVDREFAYGAGHINPVGAVDPGLIFDVNEVDYTNFLCKQGYNSTVLKLITGDNSTCKGIAPGRGWDLNYPSFSLYLADGQEINATFTRTVTNVGKPSTYQATLNFEASTIFNVTVEPSILIFSSIGEKKSFTVKVTGPKISQQPIISGFIVWVDGVHEVKTPLVVHNYIPETPSHYYV